MGAVIGLVSALVGAAQASAAHASAAHAAKQAALIQAAATQAQTDSTNKLIENQTKSNEVLSSQLESANTAQDAESSVTRNAERKKILASTTSNILTSPLGTSGTAATIGNTLLGQSSLS